MNDEYPTLSLPGVSRLPQRLPRQVRLASYPRQLVAAGHTPSNSPGPRPCAVTTSAKTQPAQHIEVGVGWHTGITRQRRPNEDSLMALQGTCTYHGQLVPFSLFVVADGMGGHFFGQEASQIAIQSMTHKVLQDILKSEELSEDVCINIMISGVELANKTICQYGVEKEKDIGTTLTAALLIEGKVYVINVGDSRTYQYREEQGLLQITRDHSQVAYLVAIGSITPDEVYTHPERNKIYRSVGSEEGVEVDWFTVEAHTQDWLLLCSDGLWEMVRDPEIERILKYGTDAQQVSEQLMQAALDNGGVDNIGVVVVHIQ